MTTNLDAKVSGVTVFRDGARVTRIGSAHASPGEQVFLISGITRFAQDDSFRVRGVGAAALKGIDVKKREFTFEPQGDLKNLKAELEKLERRKQSLSDLIAYQESRVTQLTAMSKQFFSEFGKWYAAKESKMEQMSQMDKASLELLRDAKKKIRDAKEELRDVEAKHGAVQMNMSRIQGERRTETITEVKVTLNVLEETEANLSVTYQLSYAGWAPHYDIDIADEKTRVRRIAMVTNQTLEDWSDVSLTVSTASARPAEAVKAEPFQIDVYHPAPYGVASAVSSTRRLTIGGGGIRAFKGRPGEMEVKEEAEPEALEEPMFERYAEASETLGGTTVYELPGTVSIPSGTDPHPITLMEETFDSRRLHYWNAYAMQEVVAQDEIMNGDSVLLPGLAKVYVGGDFIGETSLAMVAPREKFRLGTRNAYDVKAEKKLVLKDTEKAGISRGKRRREYKYRLAFKNFAKEKTEIKVVDRIPHSSSDKVTVTLQTPSLAYEKFELGVIEWNAAVEPAKELNIDYGFIVEWEQQLEIRPPLP
ncbi:MAG: hypothetical protein C4K49_05895 [Candidatus Thorarchaeota archaeon]|nr:MAG: hypothetical protein C4K49_05895 [Candidatus Thorarchaeota archaeon]